MSTSTSWGLELLSKVQRAVGEAPACRAMLKAVSLPAAEKALSILLSCGHCAIAG